MENPYEPPRTSDQYSPMSGGPLGRNSKMVGQVPIVAILLMVEGGLEVVMGLLYAGMAAFMPLVMQQGAARQEPNLPANLSWFLIAVYGGLGLIVFVAAGIKLYAGWQNYHYRGRTL